MGLDGLVPFVYLVRLGVLRLGVNVIVMVHLPKYPFISYISRPSFIPNSSPSSFSHRELAISQPGSLHL
ncbi:hypothetical protein Scep_012599 [Stephania cephalantha]|uniref:Uncharacterized protein n=1 Tax=Stephania cephalantha TaxID=152367 RepID=A0AAP0JF82_9MAGN